MDKKRCIVFVGAGGKTSAIYSCARQFLRKNNQISGDCYENNFSIRHLVGDSMDRIRKVLILTTTKMNLPDQEWQEYTVLNGSAGDIIYRLKKKRLCIAGTLTAAMPFKMSGIQQNDFKAVFMEADVILVEGDGSKGLPLKFPASFEPVFPSYMTDVVIVAGLSGIGKPLSCVCHRKELAQQVLKAENDKLMEAKDVYILIKEGYIKPLQKKLQRINLYCILNQADCTVVKEELMQLKERLMEEGVGQVFTGFFHKRNP